MPSNKCCILLCQDRHSSRHRFPHPTKDAHRRFWKWVQATGNRGLLSLAPQDIYERRTVCGNHFSSDCYIGNRNQLKKNAVPTLNLPVPLPCDEFDCNIMDESSPSDVVEMELSAVPSTSQEITHLPDTPVQLPMVIEDIPSTSQGIAHLPVTPVKLPMVIPLTSWEDIPSTSQGITHLPAQCDIVDTSFPSLIPSTPLRRSLFPASQRKRRDRKEGILQELGVKKLAELTPKAKFLYKTNQILKKNMHRSSQKLVSIRKRLRLSEKYFKQGWGASGNLSQTVLSFLQSQITQSSKKSKGRRFTLDDKILSLSLLKRSGRAYRFLSNLFALPSRRTLLRLLSRLSFSTGINNAMFDHLSATVSKVRNIDRHCILMFDEMSLTPHLDFQDHLDLIEGFEDLGEGLRSPRFADKALVFMLRGLRRNYKQPVAYVFPGGSIKTSDLSVLLKRVIGSIQETGLSVHATVCDQGPSNVAAVNRLCEETRQSVLRSGGEYRDDYFLVNGEKIIPLFDPPHLMKGIRNGLLTKDLKYSSGGVKKIASWRHVMQLYTLDCDILKMLPKLTELHVIPEKIPKMKVKYCTQVFSERVAAVMKYLSLRPSYIRDIDPEALETSELLCFFDRLFDSVNGRSKIPPPGKPLRCAVSSSSQHMVFWSWAQKVLQSMIYIKGSKEVRIPSLINWGRTIKNIKCLWLRLNEIGFKCLALRNLNQDPLENKFGSIRSYGFRNNAPTCSHFVGAYKALLLNDMVAPHSVGSNCQEDDCELLDNLRSYLAPVSSSISPSTSEVTSDEVDDALFEESGINSSEEIGDTPSMSFTMSFAARSAGDILKKMGCVKCFECKRKMYSVVTHDSSATSAQSEEWTALRGSCHPSESFSRAFTTCRDLIFKELPIQAHQPGVGTHLKRIISARVDLQKIFCAVHYPSFRDMFLKLVVNHFVTVWCTSINRILAGRDTRKTQTVDTIHQAARTYYMKKHGQTKK